MKFRMKLVQTYLIITFLHNALGSTDALEHFCGKYLSNFLAAKCKLYNSPSNIVHKVRNRRGVVEDCCKKPCSQRYLLCNYCAESDAICTTPNSASSVNTKKNLPNYSKKMFQGFSRQVTDNRVNALSKVNRQQEIFLCHHCVQCCVERNRVQFSMDDLK